MRCVDYILDVIHCIDRMRSVNYNDYLSRLLLSLWLLEKN
jgi:hypothetical protein